jgi:aldehyde dehydrogenase (NAD+)
MAAKPMLVNEIQVGSEFLSAGSAGIMNHMDPTTGKVNGTVVMGGKKEIDAAVARAKEALVKWEKLGPLGRRDCLGRLAQIVEDQAEQFRALSAAETGMPQAGFIWRHKLSVEWIRTYQGFADKVHGEVTATSDDGELQYVRNEPYGVVGIIITWNSPLLSLCMKIPAALAAGNAVVVKPSELTPYTPILFARACLEAGIPPGVVSVVPGGAEAGEALVVNPDAEKISFTGGLITATRMMQTGAPLIKPFCFELGGKSAYMVFPDADIELAATLAVKELSNAGQSCKFGSRLFVHESIYDKYRETFLRIMGNVVVGDPEDMKTAMGPLITKQAQQRVIGFVEDAKRRGDGKLVAGGGIPKLSGELVNGYFCQQTLFEDVDPASPLGQEEIFGPVYSLFRFRDEAKMIEAVNSTRFGLSNYVHTRDLRTATRIVSQVKSGMVYVNDAVRRHPGAPFGGFRASGIGVEGGRAGLDEFLRKKTIGLV